MDGTIRAHEMGRRRLLALPRRAGVVVGAIVGATLTLTLAMSAPSGDESGVDGPAGAPVEASEAMPVPDAPTGVVDARDAGAAPHAGEGGEVEPEEGAAPSPQVADAPAGQGETPTVDPAPSAPVVVECFEEEPCWNWRTMGNGTAGGTLLLPDGEVLDVLVTANGDGTYFVRER
ncbi:hypothetical protein EDD28_0048 [Salana multivorans]|uniref:Uncharacterized protein n=1 Tax=Salana multivorans TaxID=120377 RepID=A0A3N2D6X2_9MICO|nr:hypothetical protein [Salana multivorans]ROR95495.1 hypothetical protein EDD28_0048 [Salana multivorans]